MVDPFRRYVRKIPAAFQPATAVGRRHLGARRPQVTPV